MRKEIMASWKKRTLALVLALTTILTTSNADLNALVSGVEEVEAYDGELAVPSGSAVGQTAMAVAASTLQSFTFQAAVDGTAATTLTARATGYRNTGDYYNLRSSASYDLGATQVTLQPVDEDGALQYSPVSFANVNFGMDASEYI
nr:hypothetical protein [Lachnospiraceae bacterium]